ncbi:hypothetical protein Q7P37_003383 [Cladosporium fusiforme]
MAMSASNAIETMHSWGAVDAADILLAAVKGGPYYKRAKAFAHKLEDALIWRGGKQRAPKKPKKGSKRAGAARKKRSSSKPKKRSVSPPQVPRITKEQRVEAQAKKQSEVAAAAVFGIRKSARASIPSGRLLAARA